MDLRCGSERFLFRMLILAGTIFGSVASSQVSDLLGKFNFIPSWRVDDVMVSYAPKGGSVGPHVDNYDVFLLQVPDRPNRPRVLTYVLSDTSFLRLLAWV